ncbi:GntR family transcriptional regulator [Mesorhizobium sp. CU2]|uniref:GntR family transcriptional regulator n=1 Tax=unclassified Mesorhizobium TaxID=325217 RepID=UPI001126D319|nr:MULTISPECIES: GntR family transcriptional regulator [unclassified Mesorhizobium]TPN81091.1 GntR family transcriptional regulator [Mesorhizobium sp. CU3]TPO11688.1 GntR family transcriptional regulator [Mesorhizobium sp. CU2]
MKADSFEAAEEDPGLNRNSLSERIYARLRLALMTGEYEPGGRLNIRKLAAGYKTSPTPVREAIIQLVREGALELPLGYQPRVPVLSIPKYIDIRETRAPLERLAAELSTVNIGDDDVRRLRRLHAAFVDSEASEHWKAALSANQEFHFTIYRASKNDVLVRVIENLWLLAGPFVNNQYPNIRQASSDVHPHLLIIDALVRRSPSEVGELVVRDMREGSYRILEQLRLAEERKGKRRRKPE